MERRSTIIRRSIDQTKFEDYKSSSFITFFLVFGSIFYHCIYGRVGRVAQLV